MPFVGVHHKCRPAESKASQYLQYRREEYLKVCRDGWINAGSCFWKCFICEKSILAEDFYLYLGIAPTSEMGQLYHFYIMEKIAETTPLESIWDWATKNSICLLEKIWPNPEDGIRGNLMTKIPIYVSCV